MNRRSVAGFAVLAGAGLAASGLAVGPVSTLLAAPLAIGLLAVGLWLRRAAAPTQSAWLVGLGSLAALLGGGVALTASWAGLVAAGLGVAVIFAGTQLALAREPLPAGLELPDPLGPGLNAAVAVDEGLRFVRHVSELLDPPVPLRAYASAIRAAAERHRDLGWTEHPERAHPVPPALEKVSLGRRDIRGVGVAEHLSFDSEYEPHDAEIRDGYLEVRPNRTAHATLWRHARGPRPTLLCVHGYGMGRIGWDARVWDVPWMHHQLGLDLALVVLPLHGPRARGRRSGEGFLGGHPLWTNAACGQAIWELRRLSGWLRGQGAPAVGVYGLSLGGYLTALYASLEHRLACAIPGVPFASWADLVLRGQDEEERLAGSAVGVTRAALEDVWAPHAPLRHTPRLAPSARLILAGLADRICPPDQAHALWEHWDRPAIHWFPGSHLVPRARAASRQRLAAHLRETLVTASDLPLTLTRFRSEDRELKRPVSSDS